MIVISNREIGFLELFKPIDINSSIYILLYNEIDCGAVVNYY